MKLIPGLYYKVFQYAWSSPEGNPVYEDELGVFLRVCPEIPDWNNSVLEFMKDDVVFKFRARPIHKFVEFTNTYFMQKAEQRMYERLDGRTLKEEIMNIYLPFT